MSVDDLQVNSIFVAGRTTDGTRPFLVKWDGSRFNAIGDGELLPPSGISQLTFVPVNQARSGNDVMENNRLLVVSGALSMQSYGNVSCAFFDGSDWIPFLNAIDMSGQSGVVRGVTRSTEVLKFPNLHQLAVGLVILISIAIGLGIVFLLVLLGLIWALTRRRPKDKFSVPISASDDSIAHPENKPGSLLATLNAATENVMGAHDGGYSSGYAAAGAGAAAAAGAGAAAGYASSSSGHRAGGESTSSGQQHMRNDSAAYGTNENSDETGRTSTVYHSDGVVTTGRSGYYTTDSSNEAQQRNISMGAPMAAFGGEATSSGQEQAVDDWEEMADQTTGFVAHARYSFDATHPSELSVHAGQQLEILSDEDDSWWLARDGQGRRGVIPATYVL
jgi:uncharacterized protein YaiE (UPF0345 family)